MAATDAAAELQRLLRGEGAWGDGAKVGRVWSQVWLQAPYAEAIFAGEKTVEGRLASGWAAAVRPGDCVCFRVRYPPLQVVCRVRGVSRHPSFKAMLQAAGLEACLPACASLDGGVAIYHGFPGYAAGERARGVAAVDVACVGKLAGPAGYLAEPRSLPPLTQSTPPTAAKRGRAEGAGDGDGAPPPPKRGARLRVLSKTGVARACTVLTAQAGRVQVHYDGFLPQFDEWLDAASPRVLRDPGGEQPVAADEGDRAAGSPLRVGAKVAAQSRSGARRACTVIGADTARVQVHYDGFANQFDEWLPRSSARLLGPMQ